MTFSGIREDKTLPSDMIYGDVRQKPLEEMFNYYRLNRRQRNEILWISKKHLDYYCELQDVVSDKFHQSLTMARLGSSVYEHWIIVTSSIWHVGSLKLTHVETRHIKIGIKGGKILLNPARRGNYITGKAVLRVPAKSGL